jgi:monofunctional biosynthetic peptidoglycan transglycosylase
MNWKKKKYEHGASTISQQVVKNLFLSNEKSINRKIREILITYKLEGQFSKNQILEIYLNIAELGPDIFGIQEAARYYFKKHPMKVNAAEGAFIALMLPSPRKFHFTIFENQNLSEKNQKKLRRVIGDLHSSDYISAQQYREYLNYNYFRKRFPAGEKSRFRP